ncbi:MAG TPA: membrane-bound PQQ-dependent dehydrogenase, glucose/quinate/shikimate family [Caulobacteraceae bacterium]|jgi:quinoprotein glucose dehydrogenase|nr:membrane-bound PQQ-dependent dehydrogenase, glucose/quinate/shikimate family [Caulobacteraceae bacterium]
MFDTLRARPVISGALTAIFGAVFVILGVWLTVLGGSVYYLIAGLVLVASGVMIALGRREGLWLYGLAFVGTILWALWEVGLDGWRLMPRVFGPALWGVWLCLPPVAGKLARPGDDTRRLALPLVGAAACAIAAIAVIALGYRITALRFEHPAPVPAAGTATPSDTLVGDSDWIYYGRTASGDRFSPLTQITPANVSGLKEAWRMRTGDMPKPGENSKGHEFNFEATPIKVGDALYFCTPHREVFAVDSITGKTLWRFKPDNNTHANVYLACRGVAYWKTAGASGPCAERIISTTGDTRMFALDARTGALCADFGAGGYVNLRDNMGPTPPGFHFITSQPLVMNGRVMFSGWVYDNQTEDEPSGVIKALDPVSGKTVWAWDMGRADPTAPLKPGELYTRGTSNGWGTYTADPALNLVYVPLGNPTPDYFGGYRRPFDERYSSTLVALDIGTGKERWHFQTVHHDLWDFDLPIGPSLVDLPGPGGAVIPALVQTTKQGQLFLLDRRDGHPLAQVSETPVTVGKIPGERYSPTQPMSVGMPSLTPPKLTERDMWGATPFDQLMCRIAYRKMDYDGLFTPPSQRGNIGYPAFDGVVDWYGATIDPDRKLLIADSSYIPFTYKLVPHQVALNKKMIKPWAGWSQPYPTGGKFTVNPQYGTPFAAVIKPFLNVLQVPCNAPPWGKMTAIDLVTHKVVWRRPMGSTWGTGPFGLHLPVGLPTGIFTMGGSVVTRSGLVFASGTADQTLRAVDERTGKVLWHVRLPAGGNANPMTYAGRDGRQYVVIAAGGHGGLKTKPGDYVVAYALPARR